MDPNATVKAINDDTGNLVAHQSDYPILWRARDLQHWREAGGFRPTVPFTADAAKRLRRCGFGGLVSWVQNA